MSVMSQSSRGLSQECDVNVIQVFVSWVWCHSHPNVCLMSVMSSRGLSQECDVTVIQVFVSWVWCHSHPDVCLMSVMSQSSRGLSQECDVNVIQVFVSWGWCHCHPGVCPMSLISQSFRGLSHEDDVTVIQGSVSTEWDNTCITVFQSQTGPVPSQVSQVTLMLSYWGQNISKLSCVYITVYTDDHIWKKIPIYYSCCVIDKNFRNVILCQMCNFARRSGTWYMYDLGFGVLWRSPYYTCVRIMSVQKM